MVRGQLASLSPDHVIIFVGGIGLRVLVPTSTLAELGRPGAEITLHTHLYVREDQLALYGFLSAEGTGAFRSVAHGVRDRPSGSTLAAVGLAAGKSSGGDLLRKCRRTNSRARHRAKDSSSSHPRVEGESQSAAYGSDRRGAVADADVVEALVALGYSTPEAQAAADGAR